MCLAKIYETFEPDDTVHTGYKIVNRDGDQYYSRYTGYAYGKKKEWRNNFRKNILYCEHPLHTHSYESGFHILTNLNEAKDYYHRGYDEGIIVKVKYKKLKTRGLDGTYGGLGSCFINPQCDIADEMMILEEIDE